MRTVPAPVRIAELRARQCCTSARDTSPLIHMRPPPAGAVRASRLIASFSRIQGRPRSNREKNPTLSARASVLHGPTDTLIPAASRRSTPAPATLGLGSMEAHTTRADAGPDQGVGARRRASVVTAGLERHIGRRASRVGTRRGERGDLGVRLPRHARANPRRRSGRPSPECSPRGDWDPWCTDRAPPATARAPCRPHPRR